MRTLGKIFQAYDIEPIIGKEALKPDRLYLGREIRIQLGRSRFGFQAALPPENAAKSPESHCT